ncbi:MAG: flavin-containing monooxygenase [Solirubrobacteraceae bacterium]
MSELPHLRIAIAGAGFAGLGMAIALRRAGIDDFVVLERATELGGTWRENHYPGCACDVPTPLYSFSFAPNPHWSHLYARSEEIRAYLEDCADRFDVRRKIRFGTDVTGAEWDEAAARWKVEVDGRAALTADFVIGGFGGLNRPAYPDLEGLEGFTGALFHSAQWNHGVPLAGKRVGVIGTGASAIQLIPKIAEQAGQLIVFQRTPAWVMPKVDWRISQFEQGLYSRVPLTQRALRGMIFAITDGLGLATSRRPQALRALELVARAHMRRAIPAAELRRRLTPDYRLGCKRILFSNDFYPALTRPNVAVQSERIVRVRPRGIETADGASHPLDVLVCSTGFRIEEVFMALDVRGEGGRSLSEAWAGGIEAHRGTGVAGFPNLALLSGPNTGTGSTSQVYMIEAQIGYVMQMLESLEQRRAVALAPRPQAQASYNGWLQEQMKRSVWLRGGCSSWYLDEHGVNRTLYPGTGSSFARSLRRLRADEYVWEPARHAAPARETVGVR